MHKRFFSEQNFYRLRRKRQRRRQKREEAHAAHPWRTSVPFLCLSGVVLAGAITAASCTLCYQVESQGQPLAFFQDAATYDQAVAQAESRASQILSSPVSLTQDLALTTTLAPKDRIEGLSGVTGSILESIPQLDHVYTLTVDGTTVGVNGDADVITQALNLVKEHYTTAETRSLYIESQVDIQYQYLPAGTQAASAEEMAQAMLAASPRTFDYTVQEGDTLESVTELFSMTEERFRELNPGLTLTTEVTLASSPLDEDPGEEPAEAPAEDAAAPAEDGGDSAPAEDTQDAQETETPAEEPATIDLADLLGDQVSTPLEEGSTITIEQNCPLLLVSTVEEATVTRDIAPTLETQEDPTMFLGQQRVVQEGQAGQASVLSRVVKRCGVPVANNDVSSVVLSEPTSLIVGTGTKDMPELPDGCLFLWPVQGTITSPFGYRYIFGETNFHRGLDIAAPMGTAINAAADGTVTFAGVRGTYGNLVVITHDNGFVTYYAHCSKLLVEAGDQVTQGTPIAAVGSTGRSTGPHCHFEVRYQNEPVDPLAYLPGENNAPVRAPIDVEEEPEETPEEEAPETEPPEPETPQEPAPDAPAEPSTPPEEPSDQPETPTVPEEPVQPEPPADDPAAGGDTPDPAPETQPALPAQQAKEPDAVG